MYDLIGVIVECVTKVDGVVSAWLIKKHRFLAWWLLIEGHDSDFVPGDLGT